MHYWSRESSTYELIKSSWSWIGQWKRVAGKHRGDRRIYRGIQLSSIWIVLRKAVEWDCCGANGTAWSGGGTRGGGLTIVSLSIGVASCALYWKGRGVAEGGGLLERERVSNAENWWLLYAKQQNNDTSSHTQPIARILRRIPTHLLEQNRVGYRSS